MLNLSSRNVSRIPLKRHRSISRLPAILKSRVIWLQVRNLINTWICNCILHLYSNVVTPELAIYKNNRPWEVPGYDGCNRAHGPSRALIFCLLITTFIHSRSTTRKSKKASFSRSGPVGWINDNILNEAKQANTWIGLGSDHGVHEARHTSDRRDRGVIDTQSQTNPAHHFRHSDQSFVQELFQTKVLPSLEENLNVTIINLYLILGKFCLQAKGSPSKAFRSPALQFSGATSEKACFG